MWKSNVIIVVAMNNANCNKLIIYKVTNLVNNKIYIGKTILGLNRRMRAHYHEAEKRSYKMVFHDALRKYGKDNFVWEILDTVMLSDLLLDLEKFYIAKYNSKIPNGYNMTDGGDGMSGYKPSEETRKKWWKTGSVGD